MAIQWSTLSSTWHELRTVRMVLEALVNFEDEPKNERIIWWFTKNKNVVRLIEHGSFNMVALNRPFRLRF